MKFPNTKSTIILCFLILIFSCKKESEYETLSKSNPSISGVETTEKTETTNTKKETINEDGIAVISEKDSIAKVSTAFATTKNGNYKYKYKLEAGKSYPLKIKSTSTKTNTFRDKSMTEKTVSYQNLNFKVLQAQNGFYKIAATYNNLKTTISADGKTITVNPNSNKPEYIALVLPWMVQKAKLGQTINFLMDEQGNISNIKGFENIHAKIKAEMKKEVQGEELENYFNAIKQQVNKESFKSTFEQGIVKFPKKGVKVGGTWSIENGPNQGTTHFTLSKIENGKAYIVISTKIPNKSETETQEGITATLTFSMKQNGTVVLDTQSGWIHNAHISDEMKQIIKQSRGSESQTQSSISKSVTTINK